MYPSSEGSVTQLTLIDNDVVDDDDDDDEQKFPLSWHEVCKDM